ncbi:jg8512 [Pararge aegeria aegeria]|uniref:Jg8512 protein n=2 Tax=Pararge aegeria TaxID=116150 RepID=A0A8S4REC9_9NEOP|nr:jg8512 [Pararge aegeria aegeria]
MYYSSAFVFCLVAVVNISLGGAQNFGHQRNTERESLIRPQTYSNPNTVVNIGNGVNRRNIVTLDQGSNNGGNNQRGPAQAEAEPLSNRFNTNYEGAQRRVEWSSPTVNNIGNGVENSNTVMLTSNKKPIPNIRVNGGQAYESRSGTDSFNVGYGLKNSNKIYIDGREILHSANGGTPLQTHTYAQNARNSGGFIPNTQINHIMVNGKRVTPDYVDNNYSTYKLNGQTIHVQNAASLQPAAADRASVQRLYNIDATLKQVQTELRQEAAKLNVRL